MLIVNRIGPTKIKKVVLSIDSVEVYLVDGRKVIYGREDVSAESKDSFRRSPLH